jgi:hypothetical protein
MTNQIAVFVTTILNNNSLNLCMYMQFIQTGMFDILIENYDGYVMYVT